MTSHEGPPRASERQVLALLATHGAMTRRAVADRTGLPLRTVAGAAARLLARGVVVERAQPPGPVGVGRPAAMLDLPVGGPVSGVVVIRHHDIRAAYFSSHGERLSPVVQRAFRWSLTDDLAGAVSGALGDAAAGDPSLRRTMSAAVVGVPMPYKQGEGIFFIDRYAASGRRSRRTYPAWVQADVAPPLAAVLGVPVTVENEVNLAALGEAALGVASDADSVLFVRAAQYLAAGIVVERRILRGAQGAAGELGHVRVDPRGAVCNCGARGCLGTVASTDSLVSRLRAVHGADLEVADLLAVGAVADAGVREALRELGSTIGTVLAPAVVMINPEVVVVDGTFGPAGVPFARGLQAALCDGTPAHFASVLRIEIGSLGEAADLYGASVLARSLHPDGRSVSGPAGSGG